MTEKRKRRKSTPKPVMTVAVIVAVLIPVLIGVSVLGIFTIVNEVLEPSSAVADGFMDALREEDYERAFALMSTGLQVQADRAERLEVLMQEYNAYPESWGFYNRSVKNDNGLYSGEVTLRTGEKTPIVIRLWFENTEWRITSFEWDDLSSRNL